MGRLRSSPCCTARSHSRVDSESSRISPQVVYLLLGLLADQKLLLTASDPAVLVPAAQALRALMLPLAHSATCLPFLPPARFAHFCVRNGWLLRLGTSRTSRRLCSRRRTWRRSISEAAFFFFRPAAALYICSEAGHICAYLMPSPCVFRFSGDRPSVFEKRKSYQRLTKRT